MDEIAKTVEKLRLIVRILNRRAQAGTGEGSPTRSEQAVLGWLDEKEPLTPTALANLERVRPQSMGQTLDSLVQRGLVTRTHDTSDRRQLKVSLTPEGRQALQKGRDMRQTWLAGAIASRLTEDEQNALFLAIDLLYRVVAE